MLGIQGETTGSQIRDERNGAEAPDRDPEKVKMAYTPDSIWRNRDTFLQGRDEIVKFLTDKWSKENGYRLRKELFAFTGNKVSGLTPGSPRNGFGG